MKMLMLLIAILASNPEQGMLIDNALHVAAGKSPEGIGKYVVGHYTEISLLRDFGYDSSSVPVASIETFNQVRDSMLCLFQPDEYSNSRSFARYLFATTNCDRVSTYFLPNAKLDGMVFRDLRLTFYEGVLFRITVSPPDQLFNRLKKKFGRGQEITDRGEEECFREGSLDPQLFRTSHRITSWRGANTWSGLGVWFHPEQSGCEGEFTKYFFIVSTELQAKVESCEER